MIIFFVSKRKATFLARSLLILACCFKVMLGGMLVTNESHAQTCETIVVPGDVVVVQNVGPRGVPKSGLIVRAAPRRESLQIGGVFDGDKGRIRINENNQYIKSHGNFIWYYVEWVDSGQKGWSAGIFDDDPNDPTNKYIVTVEEAKQKDVIAEALFNRLNHDDITHAMTQHDYNDYKCNANWKKKGKIVYKGGGGHSGWDVRTRYEDDETLRNADFFSLTTGTLLTIPKDGKTDASNTIAVRDAEGMTTLYLHAHEVLVVPNENNMVYIGQLLGRQGKTGDATGEHVHIEVHEGDVSRPVPSANETTINPISYLYKWVADRDNKWVAGEKEGGGADGTRQFSPQDVNRDGRVDRFDLLEVLRNFGKDNPQCDVNGDGEVNIEDRDEINAHLDDLSVPLTHPAPNLLEGKTRLLTNYPNPFNPETWIPYQLARSAHVTISIHAADGTSVRTLDLGHRPAGFYLERSRAAYWDGRNALGEEVASGIYFYTLSAGDFTATRRMLISR